MAYSEYNHLIKNYSTIRTILKYIAIYGCYEKEQMMDQCNISSRKYDNETRRCRLFCNKNNYLEIKNNRKKIIALKYDRYQDTENFLVNSYKTKTFTKKDIHLHFLILQILSDKINPISIEEILEQTCLIDEQLDTSSLRLKLNEMSECGFVEKINEGNYVFYKLAQDLFEGFTTSEIIEIYDAISFYNKISPISVSGKFFQDTILAYLQFERKDEYQGKDIFIFKNNYLYKIVDDHVVQIISNAYNQKNMISVELISNKNNYYDVIPIKIISDYQYGRRYLFGYNLSLKKPVFFRIDNIENVEILEEKFDVNKYDYLEKFLEHSWCATLPSDLDENEEVHTIKVEIDCYFNENENYILDRLKREKRWGRLSELSEGHWLFNIHVNDPIEMIPWIRSFGEHLRVRSSNNHNLGERINENWKEALKKYGVI